MRSFFDSSAFAKRYVEEDGSERVEELCQQTTELAVSVICVPEVISALNRRKREKVLSLIQYRQAKERLLEDIQDAAVVNLTADVIQQSIVLLESHKLRAMDALHIGCAMEWRAEMFVSADEEQAVAARRSGLKTTLI